MNEEIKKGAQDAELNLEDLDKVAGGRIPGLDWRSRQADSAKSCVRL